jgi:hypothetical protein
MRIQQRFALLIAIVGLLGILACAQSMQSSQPGQATFSLTISTPQNTVRVGSDVKLEITMTNTSDQDIFYGADLGGKVQPFAVDVRDTSGNLVPKRPRKDKEPRGGSFLLIPIHPAKSIKREWILNKDFDISKPGRYTVQAKREAGATNSGVLHVKSNRITITVVP